MINNNGTFQPMRCHNPVSRAAAVAIYPRAAAAAPSLRDLKVPWIDI
jgi:hypothetical protein